MTRHARRTTKIAGAVLSAAVMLSMAPATIAGDCGPGPEWVAGCPAGDDEFHETGALVGIDLTLDGRVDTSLILNGPVTVRREAAVPSGPDEFRIITEIVSMVLEGGGVILRAGADAPSQPATLGTITQQDNQLLAESQFAVFFEIELADGTVLHNETQVPVRTVIREVPPFTEYIKPEDDLPVALFNGTEHVANLVRANHDTRSIPPHVPAVSPAGMALLAALFAAALVVRWFRRRSTTA
jgi:hypothetical protein